MFLFWNKVSIYIYCSIIHLNSLHIHIPPRSSGPLTFSSSHRPPLDNSVYPSTLFILFAHSYTNICISNSIYCCNFSYDFSVMYQMNMTSDGDDFTNTRMSGSTLCNSPEAINIESYARCIQNFICHYCINKCVLLF